MSVLNCIHFWIHSWCVRKGIEKKNYLFYLSLSFVSHSSFISYPLPFISSSRSFSFLSLSFSLYLSLLYALCFWLTIFWQGVPLPVLCQLPSRIKTNWQNKQSGFFALEIDFFVLIFLCLSLSLSICISVSLSLYLSLSSSLSLLPPSFFPNYIP